MQGLGAYYEIIFVDDRSTDKSFALMKTLHEQEARPKFLKLSRNCGHRIALTAGIDYAKGEAMILMDADLQDQPEEIPKLTEALEGTMLTTGEMVRKFEAEETCRAIPLTAAAPSAEDCVPTEGSSAGGMVTATELKR